MVTLTPEAEVSREAEDIAVNNKQNIHILEIDNSRKAHVYEHMGFSYANQLVAITFKHLKNEKDFFRTARLRSAHDSRSTRNF